MDFSEIQNILSKIIFVLFGVLFILQVMRILRSKYAKPTKVKATVINKQAYVEKQISHTGEHHIQKYVITFLCGNKNMSFDVSADTYSLLKLKQKGTLTYKGLQFWNFD